MSFAEKAIHWLCVLLRHLTTVFFFSLSIFLLLFRGLNSCDLLQGNIKLVLQSENNKYCWKDNYCQHPCKEKLQKRSLCRFLLLQLPLKIHAC